MSFDLQPCRPASSPAPFSGAMRAFLAALRLWLSCVYPSLRGPISEASSAVPYIRNRHQVHMASRGGRRAFPVSRNTSALRAFLPRGLSHTQFLERASKLSFMGRFQIYDFLNYRWEFWKAGALKARNIRRQNIPPGWHLCRAPLWPN